MSYLIDHLNDLLVNQGVTTQKGRSMILWDYDEAASQFRYGAHVIDDNYLKITVWDVTPEEAAKFTAQDAIIAKLQDEKARMLEVIQYLCDCNKCDSTVIMTALGIEEN